MPIVFRIEVSKHDKKTTKQLTMSEAIQEPKEEDEMMLKSPVKKTLNLADVSSSGSKGDAPQTPPTASGPKRLKDTLLELTASGKLSMEDFTKLVAGLNIKKVAAVSAVRERAATGHPSEDDHSRPPKARSSGYSRDWETNIEDDLGITSRDLSDRGGRGRGQQHFTTVIQNMTLKSFDCSKNDPEEARNWLSKFMHNGNMAGWSPQQRLDAFADSLTNPARYRYRQRLPHVRNAWKSTLNAFYSRYCTDNVSPMRLYHAMTQKPDESPLNYFYRFNAVALRAKLDIRRENEEDEFYRSPPPSDLKDHLEFFWDSLHDHAVAERFRFDEYRSITQVERLLCRRERTMVKVPEKKERKVQNEGGQPNSHHQQ